MVRHPGSSATVVNTTDSRVELEYDVSSSDALTPAQRSRAADRLVARLVDGRLVVVAGARPRQRS